MSEQAVIDRARALPEASEPAQPGSPLGLAALIVLALAAVWALASLVPAIHYRDALALNEFTALDTARSEPALKFLLHLLDPSLFILWAIALVAVALAGDRPRSALAVAAGLTLAPFTAGQLKALLRPPHDSR